MAFVTTANSSTGSIYILTRSLFQFYKVIWICSVFILTAQVGIGSNDSTGHRPSPSGTIFIQEGTILTLSPGTEISAKTSDGSRIIIRAKQKQVIAFRESAGLEADELPSAILATGSAAEEDLEICMMPVPAKHPPIARKSPPAVPKPIPVREPVHTNQGIILWTGPGSPTESSLLTGTGGDLCPCSFKSSALPETEPAFLILHTVSRFRPDQETGEHAPSFLLPANRAPPLYA